MLMIREKAKLFQKTLVRDEFGGSKEVLNYIKDIYGRAVPATEIYSNENNKIQVETDMKFISEERLTGIDLVVEYEGKYYEVVSAQKLFGKGSLLGMKANG